MAQLWLDPARHFTSRVVAPTRNWPHCCGRWLQGWGRAVCGSGWHAWTPLRKRRNANATFPARHRPRVVVRRSETLNRQTELKQLWCAHWFRVYTYPVNSVFKIHVLMIMQNNILNTSPYTLRILKEQTCICIFTNMKICMYMYVLCTYKAKKLPVTFVQKKNSAEGTTRHQKPMAGLVESIHDQQLAPPTCGIFTSRRRVSFDPWAPHVNTYPRLNTCTHIHYMYIIVHIYSVHTYINIPTVLMNPGEPVTESQMIGAVWCPHC